MFEGIALLMDRDGVPIAKIFAHNLTDQTLTDSTLKRLQSKGHRPFIFRHLLEHHGPASVCDGCVAAINEMVLIEQEKMQEEANAAGGGRTEGIEGSTSQAPPMEEQEQDPTERQESNLTRYFRALPGAKAPGRHS